jgi:hypothetical protein
MPFGSVNKKKKKSILKTATPKVVITAPVAPAVESPYGKDQQNKDAVFSLIAVLAAVAKTQHDRKSVSEKIRVSLIPYWMETLDYLYSVAQVPIDIREIEIVAKAVQDGKIDDNAEGYMRSIGKSLMMLQKSAAKSMIYEHEDLRILNAIGVYFRNKSESSWREIVRQIERIAIPELTSEFAPPIAGKYEFMNLRATLNERVRKLLDDKKTDAYRLTFQQARVFQNKSHVKAADYKEYSELQRQLRKLWDNAVIAICRRSSGVKAIQIDKVRETLAANGIDVDYFPEGFEGKVGIYESKISLFTLGDRAIYGWPLPGRKVKMNKDYDNKTDNASVFIARDEEGNQNYYQTFDFRQRGQEKKFATVREALVDIDGIRKRWEAPLKEWTKGSKITLDVITSAQAVMVYETQARIGGADNKSTVKKNGKEVVKNTFGFSTWRMKHVRKLTATEVKISYSGKKGVKQSHRLVADTPITKKLLDLLNRLAVGKEPNDFLWSSPIVKNGNYVSASDFNKFLKTIGVPAGFTAHKIRHAKGTKIARDIMAAKPYKINETESHSKQLQMAGEWFKKNIAFQVALALGHKKTTEDGGTEALWSTSVKSYIDPTVSANWFKERGLRPPTWIPKAARGG